MKFTADRPFADPEKAARKLLEIANATEAIQDGRLHIEKLNKRLGTIPPVKNQLHARALHGPGPC